MRLTFHDAIGAWPAVRQDTSRRTRDEGGNDMRYIFSDESSACATRLVTDRDLREEVEFHQKREPEGSIRVRTTDVATSPRQEFAALRKLNEVMRKFWATQ
jgi:hypothetical protein